MRTPAQLSYALTWALVDLQARLQSLEEQQQDGEVSQALVAWGPLPGEGRPVL